MGRSAIFRVAASVTFLLLIANVAAEVLKAQCSACKGIAAVLQDRLDDEVPRNHIDLRGRLDAQGNRHGKVIEYRSSELRVHKLLEGLCSKSADSFVLSKTASAVDPGKQVWAWLRINGGKGPINISGSMSLGGPEQSHNKKLFDYFCGRLLETHEDALVEALMADVEAEDKPHVSMERLICVDLANLCKVAPKPTPEQLREMELQRQVDAAMSSPDSSSSGEAEGEGTEEVDAEGREEGAGVEL